MYYKGNRYKGFRRPIGQWNCRHIAFAIILGVSVPNHTDEELERIKKQNLERNITIDGKQYTGYEAMQLQRKLENEIKHTKDRQTIATAAGDQQMINQERLRLKQLTQKYKEVSDKAGLPYRAERLKSVGYGATEPRTPGKAQESLSFPKVPQKTTQTVDNVEAVPTAEIAEGKIGGVETAKADLTGGENSANINLSTKVVSEKIAKGEYSLKLSSQQYLKHVVGTPQYEQYRASRETKGKLPQSYLTISQEEAQNIILEKAGKGVADEAIKTGSRHVEFVDCDKVVGYYFDKGEYYEAKRVAIHYGKRSTHFVSSVCSLK
jgi:hypothetical protein